MDHSITPGIFIKNGKDVCTFPNPAGAIKDKLFTWSEYFSANPPIIGPPMEYPTK